MARRYIRVFKSSLQEARDIVNYIPNDGCLFVFNAPYIRFRKAVSEEARGMLKVHACNPGVKTDQVRDLYITWRDQ